MFKAFNFPAHLQQKMTPKKSSPIGSHSWFKFFAFNHPELHGKFKYPPPTGRITSSSNNAYRQ